MKKQLLSLALIMATAAGTAHANVGDVKLKDICNKIKPWAKLTGGFAALVAHGGLLYAALGEDDMRDGLASYWLRSTILRNDQREVSFGQRVAHSAMFTLPLAASLHLIKSGIDDLRKR